MTRPETISTIREVIKNLPESESKKALTDNVEQIADIVEICTIKNFWVEDDDEFLTGPPGCFQV